uniref:Uncharacterized protein n=1 Tax=Steinernema glaseri TaxID=37863 RepID=A0A1I7ZGE2_9BILA
MPKERAAVCPKYLPNPNVEVTGIRVAETEWFLVAGCAIDRALSGISHSSHITEKRSSPPGSEKTTRQDESSHMLELIGATALNARRRIKESSPPNLVP